MSSLKLMGLCSAPEIRNHIKLSLLITRSQTNRTEYNFQSPKRPNTSGKKGQPKREKHKIFAPQKNEKKSIEKEKKKSPKTSNGIIDLKKKTTTITRIPGYYTPQFIVYIQNAHYPFEWTEIPLG